MDCIGVRDLRLWAHVGVLEHERRDGQWFSLDFSVQLDLKAAAVADDLSRSLDYGVAIQALQGLSRQVRCLTIEHFSEQMLDRLETLYGPVQRFQPIQHLLAEVLDREATHLPGQALQGLNGHAVVQAPAQVVGHGSSLQIELNTEIKAEPLAIPTFVFQHPDVGPQPQVPHTDAIHQSGRSMWVKTRLPLA